LGFVLEVRGFLVRGVVRVKTHAAKSTLDITPPSPPGIAPALQFSVTASPDGKDAKPHSLSPL